MGTSGLDHPETKEGAERGLMFRWYALLLNNALLPSWLVKATIPSPRVSPPSLAASCVWSRDFQIPLIPETKELTPGTAGSRQDCAQAPGFKCLLRLSTLGVWGPEEAGFGDFLLLLLFLVVLSLSCTWHSGFSGCSSLGFAALQHVGS